MESNVEKRRLIAVTAAATILVMLAGLLIVRVLARDAEAGAPPAGMVPPPAPVNVAELEVPGWSFPTARTTWRLRFRTDLDMLAPLGDGPRNAAEFFTLFEKGRGPRYDEATALMERRETVEGFEDYGPVVPFDDPLLIEAEPWLDQAVMDFYPDIYPIEGYLTRIPNLLFPLAMARTWIVRGLVNEDPEAGLEDCRRAIRLGRLLRQEDAVLINDLVGLACIHLGARGMFDIAQHTGDADLALLTSIVIGEVAPQRLLSSQRVTEVDLSPYVRKISEGQYQLEAPDRLVDAVVKMVTTCPDERFRGEAMMGLYTVLNLGTPPQQARARDVLTEIENGTDPIAASLAQWALSTPADAEALEEIWGTIER